LEEAGRVDNRVFKVIDDGVHLVSHVAGKIRSEPNIECPVDRSHRRVRGKVIPPLHIEVTSKDISDFLWTYMSDCLISTRAVEFLREVGVHSFTTRPLCLYDKKTSDPIIEHPYQELVVTGWGGIAPEESGIRLIKKCNYCKLLEYSGYIHPENLVNYQEWDGSDLFTIWPMPRYRFVTNRLKALLEEQCISGLRYIPISELEVRATREFGPGRLSDWMPLERAKELGDKHDIT
jgi:hypothetical protein